MKFAIGYQLPNECDSTTEIAADYRDQVSEVYFALPDEPSGRTPLGHDNDWPVAEARDVLSEELANFAKMDVGAVLLFNAACYGAKAMSHELAERVRQALAFVEKAAPLKAVTTTSLFVAQIIKKERPDIPVRASVNMRIGSITAMEQLSGMFDGFYLKRERNRFPKAISELKSWCDDNGKTLHLLANSGCLHDCAYQTFHDNLVAHEAEAAGLPGPGVRYPAPCWEYLDSPDTWHRVLQNTWIRPEDLHNYEQWFDTAKLATRLHLRPRMVLGAYARGTHGGSILDLLEPGHAGLPGMPMLDNSRFPEDWYERTSACEHRCRECGYCKAVFEKVAVAMPDMPALAYPEAAADCGGSCTNCAAAGISCSASRLP